MFRRTAVLSHDVQILLAVWILHNKKSSMLGINKDFLNSACSKQAGAALIAPVQLSECSS